MHHNSTKWFVSNRSTLKITSGFFGRGTQLERRKLLTFFYSFCIEISFKLAHLDVVIFNNIIIILAAIIFSAPTDLKWQCQTGPTAHVHRVDLPHGCSAMHTLMRQLILITT